MTRFEELSKQIDANVGTGTPMPSYRCHKEVWALKIKDIVRESLPAWKGATCRGCYAFGNACGHCERCKWELAYVPAKETIIVPEGHFGPIAVSSEFMTKHNPIPGGYLVFYKDGYRSFSPAKEFEDGYTRIPI